MWSLLLLILLVGATYQWVAQLADARRFPRQGRSVALGPSFPGLSLNLNCTGQGNPTAILDTGGGIPAVGWSLVQPEIAKFTRVCSYDRAGYGWSGAGPTPRTSLQIARELHALLDVGREEGPYLLVGHSLGGYNVRVYNHEYPNDVVGIVLVDASHEDQISRMSPALQAFEKKAENPPKAQKIVLPILIRFGVVRLLSSRRSAQALNIPEDLREEMFYLSLQPKFIDAVGSELESLPESADEVRAAGNLGDKPLIVLTAGKMTTPPGSPKGVSQKDVDDFHAVWVNDLQVQEAHLSTRGKQIVVPDSDHMISFERPDTIVNAVRDVYRAANSSPSTAP